MVKDSISVEEGKESAKKQASAKEWKSVREMTIEEIRSLPRAGGEVSMLTFEKSGTTKYQFVLHLFNKTVDVAFKLKQSAFYVIRHIWKVSESNTKFNIQCPFRLVRCKGNGKDGSSYDYYYVEVLPVGNINSHLYFNALLTPDQAEEIMLLGYYDDKTIVDRGHVDSPVDVRNDFLDSGMEN